MGRLLLSVGVLLVAAGVPSPVATAQPGKEYAVKAAFVFNFMKFVDWPEQAQAMGGDAFVVGVLSHGLPEEFAAGFRDKEVKGRRIAVQVFQDVRQAQGCHVVFITADATSQLPAMLRAVSGKPVLTVSEVSNAERADAVINLVAADTRLGFQVNLDAADASGLQISSRLLSLATAVRGGQQRRTP